MARNLPFFSFRAGIFGSDFSEIRAEDPGNEKKGRFLGRIEPAGREAGSRAPLYARKEGRGLGAESRWDVAPQAPDASAAAHTRGFGHSLRREAAPGGMRFTQLFPPGPPFSVVPRPHTPILAAWARLRRIEAEPRPPFAWAACLEAISGSSEPDFAGKWRFSRRFPGISGSKMRKDI